MSSDTPIQLASPEILLGILSTLQRHEKVIQDQQDRLQILETSNSCNPKTSRPDICGQEQDPAPIHSSSEYVESVLRLRRLFDVDSHSGINQWDYKTRISSGKQDENIETLSGHDADEWRSVSMYTSRPMSRLELDIPAVPQIPQEYHDCATDRAIHHELNLHGGTPSSQTHSPVSAVGSNTFSSNRYGSAGSVETTLTMPSECGSRHSVQSRGGRLRQFGGFKASLKRSLSHTSKTIAISGDEQPPSKNDKEPVWLLQIVSNISRSGDAVMKRSFSFMKLPGKLAAAAGRGMMNQQLKMLDTHH